MGKGVKQTVGEYYWWLEYLKVVAAYLVLVFVFPSLLFRTYLRGKGKTFWFGFCVTSSVVLVSMVVILLGLVHLLNPWVVRVLFYGSLVLSISRSVRLPMTLRYLVYKVQNRTYGGKLLAVRIRDALTGSMKRAFGALWQMVRENFLEILVLLVLLAYGMLYFSWNPLHTYGYGFSDIIVHHSWTNALQQGQVFSAGIYPEGMHCVVYAISTLFGIEMYSVLQYLQCANIPAFLAAIYLFAREIGSWKGSALVALTAFLVLKLDIMEIIDAMSRLQASLPQEFGLCHVFLIPTFLLRYLKNASRVEFRGRKTRFFWDENLVIFTLGIAASVSVHFYVTIMALFSCLGVIVVWFFKVFHWRRLVPLALSAILAVVLSFGPMLLAYAAGIPFQASIFWALNVMKSTEEDLPAMEQPSDLGEEPGKETLAQPLPVQSVPTEKSSPGLGERISNLVSAFAKRLQKIAEGVKYSYLRLYSWQSIPVAAILGWAAVGLALAYRLLKAVLRRQFPGLRFPVENLDGYAMVAVIFLVYLMAHAPGETGFPKLIAPERLGAAGHGFLMCLLILPVDLAGMLLSRVCGRKRMPVFSAAASGAVFLLAVLGGYYHGYLFLYGTRFNATVNVTVSILNNIPREQFTIVSPTDELYQVAGRGFHEEILTFQSNAQEQEYYIPTRYLFFFLEKHPIRPYQYHFGDGPAWLARQCYSPLFPGASVGTQMMIGQISDETAGKELILGNKLSDAYMSPYNREIVESRMAIYLRQLERVYPNELNVYYEDDDFICYCLEQNPDRLYNLGMGKEE